MATQTIILRPTSMDNNAVGYTPFPSDTSTTNYPQLVSEVEADDDATYLSVSGIPITGFLFMPADLNITPTAIRIVSRMRTTVANSTATVSYNIYVDETDKSNENLDTINLSQDYITYTQNIPTESVGGFWRVITDDDMKAAVLIHAGSTSTDVKASKDVRITQLYLEVDYDDGTGGEETTETIYLKENGSWTSIPCIIYQKQNGAWITADSSILENGDNFILQEVI